MFDDLERDTRTELFQCVRLFTAIGGETWRDSERKTHANKRRYALLPTFHAIFVFGFGLICLRRAVRLVYLSPSS